MPTLTEIREQFPQYADMPDDVLADALHRKFYSDIPRAEFDAKIGANKPPVANVSPTMDVVKSAATGVAKGAVGIAGLPGDINNMIGAASDWMLKKAGILSDESARKNEAFRQKLGIRPASMGDIQKSVETVTGEFYKPQTTAGEYAQTVGEFLPAAIAGPGGVARRVVTQAVVPGAASEAAGQAAKGTEYEPWARLAGGIGGAFLPGMAARTVTPLPVDQARRDAAAVLRDEGVDLTAGQASGSKALKYAESALGDAPLAGNTASNVYERQGGQFTRAALRRVGEDADRATPDIMACASQRLGQQFDDLAARNAATADRQFVDDVMGELRNYHNLVEAPNRVPAVTNFAEEIRNQLTAGHGMLPGEVYQSLRSRMETVARNTANPEARTAIRGLREALDGLMERSIAATNPADLGAWRDVRRQYRNLITLERAVGNGEAGALGIVSPAQLAMAAKNTQGRRNYVRGQGEFADLARSGQALMTPMPQSGTGPRALMQAIPAAAGAVFGSMAGPEAVMAALGTLAAPAVAGRTLMSRPVQGYLRNQVATPFIESLDPRQAALLQLALTPALPRLQPPQ